MPAAKQAPKKIRVRMYQVGFGDCFLVSFEYAKPLSDGRSERHVLIDYGTSHMPKGDVDLADIATLFSEHCGGTLDAVIASHRHKDHVSGFGLEANQKVLDQLQPKVVVRPWTEDPTLRSNAKAPKSSRRLVESLEQAQAFAAAVQTNLEGARGLRADLNRLAADQLSNQAASERLHKWSDEGKAVYLSYGDESGLESLLPGVKVHVLGPPTVEACPDIVGMRANDPEYWLHHQNGVGMALSSGGYTSASAEAAVAIAEDPHVVSGPVRWLMERMQQQSTQSVMRVVRSLEEALNNTSLILAFDVRGERMLFGGDAQIENWSYSLDTAEEHTKTRKLLSDLRLYKVGHHGSRNGTPRSSLFGLWGAKRDPERPMMSLLSTLSGVHGKAEATAVPRETLVQALKRRTTLVSTETLEKDEGYIEVACTVGEGKFERVRG